MAKIIPFPQVRKHASQMVDEIIDVRMGHKHPAVLKCLKQEMRTLLKKYFTHHEMSLSLNLPSDLSEAQFQHIELSMQNIVRGYNEHTARRANDLFLELCLSRMTICELRHQLHPDSSHPD